MPRGATSPVPARMASAWEAVVGRAAVLAGRRPERATAARLVEDLQHRLEEATGVAAGTEEHFLEFGQLVRQLASESDRLVEKSREVIEIALGRDGGDAALADAVELLRGALEAETWNQQLTAKLLAQLSESAGRMQDVRSVEEGLGKAMAVMRVVGVMFRTESARLPDDVRGLFLDLSAQIVGLESEVRDSFGAKFRAVDETRAALAEAIGEIESEARVRSEKAAHTRAVLEGSLDAMSGQIDRNRSREVDLLDMSRRLAGEASRIVMSLQAHDIISQKLAHVGHALESMREEIRGAKAGGTLARFHEFCRVEAGQLAGVEKDLRTAAASVEEATQGILAQVRSVDDGSGLLGHFSDATSTSTEMVQVLLDAFADLRQMIGAAAIGARASRDTVGPIVGALSGLNEAMTVVALKVGLVALNAQVQSVQRGDGTGLEVLSARAAQISKDAESFGLRVSSASTEVAGAIAEVAGGFEEAARRMQASVRALDADGGEHEQRLHVMRDRMLECLQELGDAVDVIRGVAERLSRVTGIWAEPLELIGTAREALTEAAEAAARTSRRPFAARTGEDHMQWMHSRYTMSSERDAHKAAMAGEEAAPASAAVTEAGDVELF